MNNLSRLRLIGNTLLNKLQVSSRYPVAIMPITRQELEKYDYKDGDLEGLDEYSLICTSCLCFYSNY